MVAGTKSLVASGSAWSAQTKRAPRAVAEMKLNSAHYRHLLAQLEDLRPEKFYIEDQNGLRKVTTWDHYGKWKRFIRSAGKSITVASLTRMARRKLNSCVDELQKDPKAIQQREELIATMSAVLDRIESWIDARPGEITTEIKRLRSELQRLRPRVLDPTGDVYYGVESITGAVLKKGRFTGEIWLALNRLGASGYRHFGEAEQEYHSLLVQEINRRMEDEKEPGQVISVWTHTRTGPVKGGRSKE